MSAPPRILDNDIIDKRDRSLALSASNRVVLLSVFSLACLVIASFTLPGVLSRRHPFHPLDDSLQTVHVAPSPSADPTRNLLPSQLVADPALWLPHLRRHPRTERIGCREYDAGAQSCVFTGLACINTSQAMPFGRPRVYLLDESKPDGTVVPSDDWCYLRHRSSDPRYFSSRHWPIKNGTFAPQRSCLDADYRTFSSLLGENETDWMHGVRWEPSLWLIDLDNIKNSHNNHLVKDILWMLDVMLWQKSFDLRDTPLSPNLSSRMELFDHEKRIYLPQGLEEFLYQTAKDINRLTYSMILQRDLSALYPNQTKEDLRAAPTKSRSAAPLFEAYPDLKDQLLFHRDIRDNNGTDLVCTPRLTVGAKIGNGAHERVCRTLRQRGYELFGIKTPPMKRLGRITYPQPPKRVIILQRHLTRRLGNAAELERVLRRTLGNYGVEIEVISTRALNTAEDHVRIFSRAGVLITPHGSQAMGQIWMPRHSSLIEVMPLGYTDYAFNMLADSCKLWYYELQGVLPPNNTEEFYMKECGTKIPHIMTPCVQIKAKDVWVDVKQAVRTTRFALERMGYAIGPWLENVGEWT